VLAEHLQRGVEDRAPVLLLDAGAGFRHAS
jgi:hypothetical protein